MFPVATLLQSFAHMSVRTPRASLLRQPATGEVAPHEHLPRHAAATTIPNPTMPTRTPTPSHWGEATCHTHASPYAAVSHRTRRLRASAGSGASLPGIAAPGRAA